MPSPLHCLICGYENGGTTALSDVLRRDPGIDAGFEGGFLLADRPAGFRDIQPHATIALRGWGLAAADMDHVLTAADWDDLYRRLAARFAPERPGLRIFDKTPAYLGSLPEVMDRMPDLPVIALVRDPRAVFASWRRRSQNLGDDWIDRFATRYLRSLDGLRRALGRPDAGRITVVRYEDLCVDPEVPSGLLASLGLVPSGDGLAARYGNVRGHRLTTAFVTDYRASLSDDEQSAILAATGAAPECVWEPPAGFVPEPPPPRPETVPPPGPPSADEQVLRNRAAGRARGGPAWFADTVIGSIDPREVVLDLGWPPVSGWRRVVDTRGDGYARHHDWVRLDPEALAERGGHFDVVIAHGVAPLLAPAGLDDLFVAIRARLAPEGRAYVSLLPGDDRPRPGLHVHAAPEATLARCGLVSDGEVAGHPAGHRVLVLRPV